MGVLESRAGEGTFLALNPDKFLGRVMGWRVATDRKNMENLMTVRLALETETASHAALNPTEEQIHELEDAVEKMAGLFAKPEDFVKADVAFHLVIAKVSANDLIFDLLNLIRGQLQHAFSSIGGWPRTPEVSNDEHRGIVEAIRGRDPESARRLMREHIEKGLQRYQQRDLSEEPGGKAHE